MPWTPKQVRYLLSAGSPLSGGQQYKMKSELHSNPSMGHAQKGSGALSEVAKKRGQSKNGAA